MLLVWLSPTWDTYVSLVVKVLEVKVGFIMNFTVWSVRRKCAHADSQAYLEYTAPVPTDAHYDVGKEYMSH